MIFVETAHTCVLREKGIYREAKVFQVARMLYAEYRKGQYINLMANGATSHPQATWANVSHPTVIREGRIVFS